LFPSLWPNFGVRPSRRAALPISAIRRLTDPNRLAAMTSYENKGEKPEGQWTQRDTQDGSGHKRAASSDSSGVVNRPSVAMR